MATTWTNVSKNSATWSHLTRNDATWVNASRAAVVFDYLVQEILDKILLEDSSGALTLENTGAGWSFATKN